MKELEQAVEALTKLRVQATKFNQEGLERSLYDVEQMIFKAQDQLSSLQSKGKPDKSKLNDRDREMEGNLSVLIGSEIAIINKGIKQEIDWQMISEWLVKKTGLESKGKAKEEVFNEKASRL